MAEPVCIWYKLAKAFKEYISECENVLVYKTKCAGEDYPSAVIRTWEKDPDFDRLVELQPEHEREEFRANNGELRIRDTIVFKADEIVCTNVTEGFIHIELAYPFAYEALLHWMKKCGLVRQEVTLKEPLAWKEPPKCQTT